MNLAAAASSFSKRRPALLSFIDMIIAGLAKTWRRNVSRQPETLISSSAVKRISSPFQLAITSSQLSLETNNNIPPQISAELLKSLFSSLAPTPSLQLGPVLGLLHPPVNFVKLQRGREVALPAASPTEENFIVAKL